MKTVVAITLVTFLAACAAKPTNLGAETVEIVNEMSDTSRCRYLGEVIGSQGNFFTAGATTNKNLILGSRNELRNEAHKLGGNIVHLQQNGPTLIVAGTPNITLVGKAYACSRRGVAFF